MVSVVIPIFNRAAIISLALNSLLKQTFQDWECWVIDDHSEDKTAELVATYQQKDARFHYLPLSEQARGANAARNEGFRWARGEYILFLDSDDALADFCLENRMEKMARQPELDFAVWPTLLFSQIPGDNQLLWNIPTAEKDLHRYLALDVPWQTAGVLWRRTALEKLGPWNEKLACWQDWEYQVRALAQGFRYEKFSPPDCYWRKPRADSIWSVSHQPEYLKDRLALLGEIEALLRQHGSFGPEEQQLLAGLYFWHAHLLSFKFRWRKYQGLTYWWQAWRRGLIDTRLFFFGFRWFLARKRSKKNLPEFFSHWPPGYQVGNSSTFQCMLHHPPK